MDNVTVELWSGREVRALREARRMSIREFAGKLGVSERMISKWEAGGPEITPRPANQHALDGFLASASAEVHTRFARKLGLLSTALADTPGLPLQREEALTHALEEGHQARHPIDGKLMTLVEAGVFLQGEGNEPIWLPSFYIDVFPTTNSDYARFVSATGYNAPQHWESVDRIPQSSADHPVVFVRCRDAMAYAAWAAKALPTSQQWEKAARGTRGDVYPWGSQKTPAKCNVREGRAGSTSPVSRYHSGVSPYGVYDMCGNIWEWCSTETEPDRYELKGGAFTSPFFRATPSTFNDASTDMLDDDTGFRCVTPAETLQSLLAAMRR